ncbi:branched-chain amino acid transport [Desulfovibrio sp. X2]|uniref:AzlD family protein n=1 Tax=Desulfovibrio sp. X2 TaxID=941449 RepID=UPI000358BFBB|nr:AzlD domain-containing protein [Desulfovibrio sp. X2]EPR39816.1 branched-chain amino acid transport [Desulfovibrio sp. X2]
MSLLDLLGSDALSPDARTWLAIAGMAVATYITRAAGLLLSSRMRLGPRGEAFLKALPGSILTAIVAPAVLAQGPAEAAASLVTVGVAARWRNLPLAMFVGVAAVFVLRRFFR